MGLRLALFEDVGFENVIDHGFDFVRRLDTEADSHILKIMGAVGGIDVGTGCAFGSVGRRFRLGPRKLRGGPFKS